MAAMAAAPPIPSRFPTRIFCSPSYHHLPPSLTLRSSFPPPLKIQRQRRRGGVAACSPSPPKEGPTSISTKLYVSGLSFRTTEESLRNAFQKFGQLVEVNLVMDRVANRPRGFAFLLYTTEEESKKAIEGMHGKFLDGRVIFVEVAKSRWELHQASTTKTVLRTTIYCNFQQYLKISKCL